LTERPDPADPHKRKPLIETRGIGGFVVTAPSNGKVHPSGKPYVLLRGGLETITTITPEERETIWSLARSFDEVPVEESMEPGSKVQPRGSDDGVRVGDDFNARAQLADIVEPFGWTKVHTSGGVEYWRRPGKDHGWSASYGFTKGFRVFTSSTSLRTESYSLFALYCHLHHNGDWAACVKDLAAQGYGTWVDSAGEEHQKPRPKGQQPGGGQQAGSARPAASDDSRVHEAADDPHRLARLYVRSYRTRAGSTLRYHSGEWLHWRDGAYRPIPDSELQAGLDGSIKAEFDRINWIAIQCWEERQNVKHDEKIAEVGSQAGSPAGDSQPGDGHDARAQEPDLAAQ
jgi:hypothetical protein